MLLGGIELDLIPATRADDEERAVVRGPKQRSQTAWLAGEAVLRGDRLGLTDLPAALWSKAACRHLSLAGNRLQRLPPDVGRLRALRRLLLGGNALVALPGEVAALRRLEHLDVGDNLIDDLPVGLAALPRLGFLNIDGNPLGGRAAPGGPTLREVWLRGNADGGSSGGGGGGSDASGVDGISSGGGGGVDGSGVEGAEPGAETAGAPAAAGLQAARRRGAAVLAHLAAALPPDLARAAKRAKLLALQAAVRARLEALVLAADPAALAAARTIAPTVGLDAEGAARVDAAAAAAAWLAAAAAGDDRHELAAALRAYEELCQPGRPAGGAYADARRRLRELTRRGLERGWHARAGREEGHSGAAAPAAGEAAAAAADGSLAAAADSPGATSPEPFDGPLCTGQQQQQQQQQQHPCEAPPESQEQHQDHHHHYQHQKQQQHEQEQPQPQQHWRRAFATPAELRRRELEAAGARTFEAWRSSKAAADARREREKRAAAAAAARAAAAAAGAAADRLVDLAAREAGWPSAMAEAYPRGTFAPQNGLLTGVK